MHKYTFRLILFVILLSGNYIFSYDYLMVRDPRGWNGGQGTIDEATLTVNPQGFYMEYNLYLTFSAKNLNLYNTDTLEVQFDFGLPQNAIVSDLWLWIGSDIMKAIIIDKWTASNIYEGIVKRRRDPAILTKVNNQQYNLKIYPLPGKSSRKIKLTYLVPASWQSNSVSAPLPLNLLTASYAPLQKLTLKVWENEAWGTPSISENLSIEFTEKNDSSRGRYFETEIQNSLFYSSLSLAFNSPMKDGIYVNKYEDGTDGYYQLAIQLSKVLNTKHSKKIAFLLDYTSAKSTFPITDVFEKLKSLLLASFTAKDSFNIILSKLDVYRKSENWLPGDSATIKSVFSALDANSIAGYSNLLEVINNGIDFVNSHGNSGEILLISNSDQYGSVEEGTQLSKDIFAAMNPVFKINVADFQNQNYSNYYFVNGTYFYGSEYFYSTLARLTKGSFSNYRDFNNLNDLMNNAFQSLNGTVTSFDLYTTLDNGFCYGRFNLNFDNNPVYLDKPLLQTGKYNGSLPLSIQLSGIFNSKAFTLDLKKTESEIQPADQSIQKAWTGNYIMSLEKQQQTNDIIGEIISSSLNDRILSQYTAFLALEPQDTIKFCKDCQDDSGPITTDIEDDHKIMPDSIFTIKPYPNPFNSQTQIAVTLPKSFKLNEASFRIYNILGQAIKTFDINEIGNSRSFRLMWNGKGDNGDNVASGVYFFVVNSPQGTHSVKLMLLK